MVSKTARNINNLFAEFSPESDPFEKARQKGPKRWILAHIFSGSNKLYFIIVFFTTIIAANLNSLIMIFVGNTVSDILDASGTNFVFNVVMILILALATPIMRLINYMIREVLAQRIERDARKEFYAILLGKSQSFHDQQKIGELMARATNDVRMLNFMISPALSLILESFTNLIVPIVYIALFYPTQLLLTPILFSILFLISLRSYIKKLTPIASTLRTEFGNMNAVLNEIITGIEVVKATSNELFELKRYSKPIKAYRDAFIEQGYLQAKYLPLLFLGLALTGSLTHAIILFLLGIFDIGQIFAYVGLISMLRFSTFVSIFVFQIIRIAITGAERLLEMMNRGTEIDENPNGVKRQIEGGIKFDNVTFTYPRDDKPVLKNISFKVSSGQTVAIVGTTGSGKTTLTKLISRLYDINSGNILIDDIDIRNYSLRSLRSQISYIEQDVFLFSTKIIDNITFGKESSLKKVKEVATQAQAHEFISELPNQFDSEVGERGVQLSGGERQRIAIARAFLSDPRILVLDDSTSAIDSETEDKIQRAIKNVQKNRTTFIITHRLSQIRWADLIIVLKHGEIVAKGTHKELLKTSEEYRNIFVKKFDVDIDQLLREEA